MSHFKSSRSLEYKLLWKTNKTDNWIIKIMQTFNIFVCFCNFTSEVWTFELPWTIMEITVWVLNFKFNIEFYWFSDGGNLNLNIHEALYDVNSTLVLSGAWILLAAMIVAATRDGLVGERMGPGQWQLPGFRFFSRTNPSSFKMFLGSRLAVILTDLHFYRGGPGRRSV